MKKTLIFLFIVIFLTGCYKEDFEPSIINELPKDLVIANSVGIKLENAFVTDNVSMNVKLEVAGTVTIKIFDISNRVVSREILNVKAGDNLLTVHTKVLPSSAYRIGIYDSNDNQLGITDFNKL